MNIYKQVLEEKTKAMQECQKNTQNKFSCIDCEKMFECNIRAEYVKAVYENMSQGKVQNFNF